MAVFDHPSHTGTGSCQLPWLRMSLILRKMVVDPDCRDEDLEGMLTMRRDLTGQGWFN
jgi:hypothetical protein